MNSALITMRTHKPPLPRFHRKWIDYDRVRDAMLARKAEGFEPRRGRSPTAESRDAHNQSSGNVS